MKTKIKILIVSCVIAAAAVTGFNMVQNKQSTGVSLADIAVMAKADGGETGGGTGECGTGYIYFCGYFYGIDHPHFYAYEGPWMA